MKSVLLPRRGHVGHLEVHVRILKDIGVRGEQNSRDYEMGQEDETYTHSVISCQCSFIIFYIHTHTFFPSSIFKKVIDNC